MITSPESSKPYIYVYVDIDDTLTDTHPRFVREITQFCSTAPQSPLSIFLKNRLQMPKFTTAQMLTERLSKYCQTQKHFRYLPEFVELQTVLNTLVSEAETPLSEITRLFVAQKQLNDLADTKTVHEFWRLLKPNDTSLPNLALQAALQYHLVVDFLVHHPDFLLQFTLRPDALEGFRKLFTDTIRVAGLATVRPPDNGISMESISKLYLFESFFDQKGDQIFPVATIFHTGTTLNKLLLLAQTAQVASADAWFCLIDDSLGSLITAINKLKNADQTNLSEAELAVLSILPRTIIMVANHDDDALTAAGLVRLPSGATIDQQGPYFRSFDTWTDFLNTIRILELLFPGNNILDSSKITNEITALKS